MMTTGERIAACRRKAGLSQEALAHQLGVSRQAVSRWETNETLPDTQRLVQLSQIFTVSVEELLNGQPISTKDPQPTFLRWQRRLHLASLCLAGSGGLLALTGTLSALSWSLGTDQWYTDFGRFGTALFFRWPGPVLLAGLLLLLTALLLLAFDTLLSRQTHET